MDRIDPTDLALLDRFQRDFPLEARPFARIGTVLGLDEAEVIGRLARMQAAGRISRVGGTVRPNTAGASTLAALAVPEARIDEVAAIVGAEPGVNHSYLREADWNLWFVATAPDGAALSAMLARIEAATGLRLLDLRLVRPFNIDLGFPLAGGPVAMPGGRQVETAALRPEDRPLLHALSAGLELVPQPYAALALKLGREEGEVTARIGDLLAAGILTRLGVIVRHRALGYTANAMVVWDVAQTEAAGRALAALPGVTLAYERVAVPGVWPYRLYCMIHARSRSEALAVLETARALPELAGADHRVLFSTRCFKQSGARLQEAA
ncbi:siroheme decarboxylase subunit beta [Tabrizicola soli]|uniref:siroheme decarboxylase n=1 Tax=Tabrizicola soli TaxID=2185115 RepID=A0ABV7DVU1_9RHOB|nr:AsnC family transcriptional regulator [Tabrizicola soli]